MSDHHNVLRRFDRTTVLGVVLPVLVICVLLLLVALLPDDGWTLSWAERPKIIHPWGR